VVVVAEVRPGRDVRGRLKVSHREGSYRRSSDVTIIRDGTEIVVSKQTLAEKRNRKRS
jgi:hypothetical protein